MSTLGHPTGKGCTNTSRGRDSLPSPRLSSQRAGRRSDGAFPALKHASRRSGGATVPPLPPLHVNRRSDGAAPCLTPPPPPPPPVPALYTWTQASRCTANLTTHGPALRIRVIAGGTPKTGKRLPRPNSESVGLRSSSAGVRSRELVLLGSLHVELSSWRRGNHPPLQQLAPPPVPVDRVEVSFILPLPLKNKTRGNHPPLQQCAPSPVLEQVDGKPRPVFEGIGGRPPILWIEPPPSRHAPGALPLERLPSEMHWHRAHRTSTPNTPKHTRTTHAGGSAPSH